MPAGTLFVVSTPIGNLEDITLRALRVLREASLIAAEDTRRTAKLLAHHGVRTPTVSFHEHSSRSRMPGLLAHLKAGRSLALVSDAGTPGISDPGTALVRACVEAGVPVDPVPGPCAPISAAVAAGFPLEPLTIFGFVPARRKDRVHFVESLLSIPTTVIFLETPHRISLTLGEMASILGDRPIMVAREMTKLHQEFLFGPASTLVNSLKTTKGEFCVVVGPPGELRSTSVSEPNHSDILDEFGHYTETSAGPRRDVVKALARKHGMSAKAAYRAIEAAKKSSK